MTVANEYLANGHQPPDGFTSTGPVREGQYKRYPDAPRTVLGNDGLGALLREVNGLTRIRWMTGLSPEGRTRSRGTLTPARRVPSSGARYPVEVYVVQREGLYHYDPAHHALERLRAGDHRASVLPIQSADLMLVLTTVFWRNMAKYGSFGYRLMNLDAGAVLGQALAVAEAMNLVPSVHLLFDDERIDRLLGLTPFAEATVAVLALNEIDPTPAEAAPATPIDPESDVARLHAASRVGLLKHANRRRSVYGYQPTTVPLEHLRRLLGEVTGKVVIAASTVEGLPAGSYDADLKPLRTGDNRIPLAKAAKSMMLADEFRYAAFTVAISAQYDLDVHGDRGYRMGTIAAGILIQRACLAASALGLDTHVHCDFDPAATAAALGCEPPVVLITAGMAGPSRADPQGEL